MDFSVQAQGNAAPFSLARSHDRHSEHHTVICQWMRSQKSAIQTSRHPARSKAAALDHGLENPANPNPGEVFRQFWRRFSETVLRCPEAAATSGCPLPCCLRTHHPEWTPTTIHRNPRRFHAGLLPDIRPAKSRGKCPRNPETCPAPRAASLVPHQDAAALCSANGCYRLLPVHFDNPALRPFPHPFSRRSRHRQRIIQREDQTSRPDRRGYSSLLPGASRVIPSRTCRSPFRKELLHRGTERRVLHRA